MSDEHEFEPSYGLPELLPQGERLLWQGSPEWRVIARRALHVRSLAVYFAVLLGWRAATVLADGTSLRDASGPLGALALLALGALGMVVLMAWLIGRTTVYTVTDRRVVMRVGVVLSVTFNLPYRRIDAAGLKLHAGGIGDIALKLIGPDRIAFAHLWPHARPWKLARTEPMLRAVPDAARVAGLLSAALEASLQTTVLAPAPATATHDAPAVRPVAERPSTERPAAERPVAGAPGRQALAA